MVYIVNGLKPYAYALDVFFELMTNSQISLSVNYNYVVRF